MKIDITITRSDVLTEVRKQSAYYGNKIGANAEQAEQITMLESQSEELTAAIDKAVDIITLICNECMKEVTSTETATTVTIDMPDNYAEEIKGQLSDIAVQLVAHNALATWFEVTFPTAVETIYNKINADMEHLRYALSRRRRPMRRTLPDEEKLDDVIIEYET